MSSTYYIENIKRFQHTSYYTINNEGEVKKINIFELSPYNFLKNKY